MYAFSQNFIIIITKANQFTRIRLILVVKFAKIPSEVINNHWESCILAL